MATIENKESLICPTKSPNEDFDEDKNRIEPDKEEFPEDDENDEDIITYTVTIARIVNDDYDDDIIVESSDLTEAMGDAEEAAVKRGWQ